VALPPDGGLIAVGCEDGVIKVWNSETGEVLHAINGHAGPVSSVTVSPDGKLLFSGGMDAAIRVWDLRGGALLNVLSGHSQGVGAVAVSPDGRLLASGGGPRYQGLDQAAGGPSGRPGTGRRARGDATDANRKAALA
jgi:WD40 repeat protein